jgi:hypothetical protein
LIFRSWRFLAPLALHLIRRCFGHVPACVF